MTASTAQAATIPPPPIPLQGNEKKDSQSAVEIFEVTAEPVEFPISKPTEQRETGVIPCDNCGLQLQVQIPGRYMCPGCGYRFQVNLQT